MTSPDPVPGADVAAQKRRNVVIALLLFAFVVLVFGVTLVRLKTGSLTGGHP